MNRVVVSANQAVENVLAQKRKKFLESVDVAIRFSSDEVMKGEFVFPYPFVDLSKFLVFADTDDIVSVSELGIEMVGNVDLIKSIKDNKSLVKNVRYCVASASLLSEVQKIAKILALRKIMPNANNGTLTKDLIGAINAIMGGKFWFQSSKAKIIHMKIGNIDFSSEQIYANLKALLSAIVKSNLKAKKSICSVSLSSTMGSGLFCDVLSLID